MSIHCAPLPFYHQPGPCSHQYWKVWEERMKQVAHSLNKRISQTGLSCTVTEHQCSQHHGGLAEDEHLFPRRLQLCQPRGQSVRRSRVSKGDEDRGAGGAAEGVRLGASTHLKDCTSGGSLQLWPRSLCTSLAAALIILSACTSLLCSPRSTCEAKAKEGVAWTRRQRCRVCT